MYIIYFYFATGWAGAGRTGGYSIYSTYQNMSKIYEIKFF